MNFIPVSHQWVSPLRAEIEMVIARNNKIVYFIAAKLSACVTYHTSGLLEWQLE
jgi:hypothetical protein